MAARLFLNLRLFEYLESIVDFNTEVSDGAFQLGVTEQELDRSQVFGTLVDQCRLGPALRMSAVRRCIQPGGFGPVMHNGCCVG